MEVRMDNSIEFARMLREHGFRATFGRVALLNALKNTGTPVAVDQMVKHLRGKLDQANTYRALEALCKAGLVRRVDLGHPHTHYELAKGRTHAHALVAGLCRICICV